MCSACACIHMWVTVCQQASVCQESVYGMPADSVHGMTHTCMHISIRQEWGMYVRTCVEMSMCAVRLYVPVLWFVLDRYNVQRIVSRAGGFYGKHTNISVHTHRARACGMPVVRTSCVCVRACVSPQVSLSPPSLLNHGPGGKNILY